MMRSGVLCCNGPGTVKVMSRRLPQAFSIRCVGTQRPLPGSRNRRPTSFRVMCGEKRDNAKGELRKSLKKARKNVKKSLALIEKELGEDVGNDSTLADSEASWAHLYEEQKVLFDREIERWNEERKMWDRREESLLTELRRLQNLVVDMSTDFGMPDTRPEGYRGEDTMEEEKNGSVPPYQELVPDATETQEKIEFFDAKQGESSSQPELSSLAASMTAAFAAVDQGDVLSDDFTELQQKLEKSMTKDPPVESTSGNTTEEKTDPDSGPLETVKSPPTGPPPVLMQGDDDIFWMNQLQRGLEGKGFCCGDEEVDDYYFGEGTSNALLSFQACNDLAETGVADEDTWRALLGENMKPILLEGESLPEPDPEAGTSTQTPVVSKETADTEAPASSQTPVVSKEATAPVEIQDGEVLYVFDNSNGVEKNDQEKAKVEPSNRAGGATNSGKHVSVDPKVPRTKNGWPAIAELDGGKEVHQLQSLLGDRGFHSGEDDMNWWYFGSETVAALKTFQACNDLPESGVCDEKTWLALCGSDAKPSDLINVESSYEEDRANVEEGSRGVWLLGEQRWEQKED